MWEESMAQVAREQEVLEQKVEETELKRKQTRRILKEAVAAGLTGVGGDEGRPSSSRQVTEGTSQLQTEAQPADEEEPKSPAQGISRQETILAQVADLSDSESEADDEFFDAVDAGEVEIATLPPSDGHGLAEKKDEVIITGGLDISSSFKGYENGIRTRLKMDADDRPKISLWVSQHTTDSEAFSRLTLYRVF
jgi:hypothetical protein